ncbi:ATP-binding protein [bacterium]|nr:MAG: ATP-binding protein [bacterium]
MEERLRAYEERKKRIKERLSKVKKRIVVFSGKGGVGKTSVAVNLAYAVKLLGKTTGLLDADITGPNVPKMIGLQERPIAEQDEIIPLEKDGVKVISIGSMIPPDTPVIWRGPLRSSALQQFLGDVRWGELDILIADLPPGTGDEVLTMAQEMEPDMAIIVTTPQDVSLIDSARAVNMARQLEVPRIGVVENMSGLICPHCGKEIDLFGKGGGKREAERLGVEFLGAVPLDIKARELADKGIPVVLHEPDSPFSRAIKEIAEKIV